MLWGWKAIQNSLRALGCGNKLQLHKLRAKFSTGAAWVSVAVFTNSFVFCNSPLSQIHKRTLVQTKGTRVSRLDHTYSAAPGKEVASMGTFPKPAEQAYIFSLSALSFSHPRYNLLSWLQIRNWYPLAVLPRGEVSGETPWILTQLPYLQLFHPQKEKQNKKNPAFLKKKSHPLMVMARTLPCRVEYFRLHWATGVGVRGGEGCCLGASVQAAGKQDHRPQRPAAALQDPAGRAGGARVAGAGASAHQSQRGPAL